MKKRAFLLILLLLAASYYFREDIKEKATGYFASNNENSTKIASWNLQIFGTSKSNDKNLMDSYANKLKNYDIIFVQEIRDSSDTAFLGLCSRLEDYYCENSSRAGRTSSKEQYGIIIKKNIQLISLKDYNPDSLDRWERPPIEAKFNLSNNIVTIFNIHTKPSDVQRELDYLNDLVLNKAQTAVIGDLNADCDFYDHSVSNDFNNWNWVIKDDEDTTVADTDCAYDRIILSDELNQKLVKYGIDKNVNKDQSDHYLVWFSIKE